MISSGHHNVIGSGFGGSIAAMRRVENPTLTIAALAEYAADKLPPQEGANIRVPLMKRS